ncbi:UvrD-helicase domain-containing protein [Gilvimarinus sp. SDUM040013]|uniref:DNA 3'-5' helicase n=1 Tax=Gilvimarinus gilvus TaxID=3058038 RepID=A0ABU4RXJ5_9GAMM|nr:UvrD-helicase domain-containing protein [Gilvimarinus sp. SDUM040013]MDO3384988.1 UvrD-helicase domain-containing protein [Gilvimarinus sp. SDUM040013]MDX6848363.1 UvrD-helicase domain-containing protein [Gilvimarinus sp. SDUM040013]
MNSHSFTIPEDNSARTDALDPTRSFAVSAPAGSGKTGLLTHRLLKLLLTVEAPEQVLAITFTNKAASEMQERVLHALSDALAKPEPEQEHQRSLWLSARAVLARDSALNWQLLNNPNRLRILTIDGLCRSIVSLLPIDSKLGGAPDNIEEPEDAYREAAYNLLEEMESDGSISQPLTLLSKHLDNQLEKVANLLISLLGKREQWLPLIMSVSGESARLRLEASLQSVITDHLQKTTELLIPLQTEVGLLLDGIGAYFCEEDPSHTFCCLKGLKGLPDTTPESLDQWQAVAQIFLSSTNDFRKRPDKRIGFPPVKDGKIQKERYQTIVDLLQEYSDDATTTLQEIKTLPTPHYGKNEWEILDALAQVLPRLAAQLWVVFAAKGASDFTEVSLAALTSLDDKERISDILLKLDHQIQHILVDEFQDTSLPQFELLERLTTGWEPGDGRTLFLVGDGMQSCYGFRNANVGLFLRARRHGIGALSLQPLDLTVNFRSDQGIVDWVNGAFSKSFPAADDISRGAVRYTASTAFRPINISTAVQTKVCLFDNETTDKDHARKAEARHVADLVAKTQAAQPGASIAVLGRARPHLQMIMQELSLKDIEFVAQDMESLATRMVITDLLTLTKVLLQPDNRVAWLSILRSPWVGLNHFDLAVLVGSSNREAPDTDRNGYKFIWPNLLCDETLNQLSDQGRSACQRLVQTLRNSFFQIGRKNLANWVYGTWLALGGPACLLRPSDHKDAEQYFSLLRDHDHAGKIRDWSAFNRAIERLYSSPTASNDCNVQLMTLHKSKGLEFDVVIIVGLDRSSRNDDKQLLLWRERLDSQGANHLLISPVAAEGDNQGPLYQHLKYEQKLQNEYELIRLFYVGCTRAIEQLYLTACLQVEPSTSGPLALDDAGAKPKGLLKQLWPQLADQAQVVCARVDQAKAAGSPARVPGTYIRRLSVNWEMPALADNFRLAHLRLTSTIEDDDPNIPELEPAHARHLRLAGSQVHRIFEQLARSPLPADADQYCQTRQSAWQAQLLGAGIHNSALKQCLDIINTAVANALKSVTGRWILDCTHTASEAEVEYFSRKSGTSSRHIIDRTFIDHNTRWIIDYKTAQIDTDEAVDAFQARLKDQYQAQLDRYKRVYSSDNVSIQCAIYNPLLGEDHSLILY